MAARKTTPSRTSMSSGVPSPRPATDTSAPDGDAAACTLDERGNIVAVNARWRAFARANDGDSTACGVGVNYLAICQGAAGDRRAGAAEVAAGLSRVLAGDRQSFEYEYSCHAPNELRWFNVRVAAAPAGADVSHRDVTVSRLAQLARARHLLRDPLTDLPNLSLLTDRLEQSLTEGARSRRLVALVLLSIDSLAALRRDRGEVHADALVIEAAHRLAGALRDGDTLGRVGDDCFAIILRNVASARDAQDLARRLGDTLGPSFVVDGVPNTMRTSIGVSIDCWAQSPGDLLDAAGVALHDSRSHGVVEVVTPPAAGEASARVYTEASLRQAMHRNELVLHYQPIVDLGNGDVVGVEALVRWQHPVEGLVGPDLFIPVAEAGGLMVPLGEWVLKEACEQWVRWRDVGLHVHMAVNLSPRQIGHPDVVPTLKRILRETGMHPGALVLEVTESAVMEDAEVALEALLQLAALGISLAIDDFGTGYSSLLYLKRYPITTLKVDRSFVSGIGVHDEDTAIVASLIGLASAVGASCVAEGVETDEQYAALRSLGAGFGQGWLFGRAVEASDLQQLVAQCQSEMAIRLHNAPPVGDPRTQAGDVRDEVAHQRDQTADLRDTLADARDQAGLRRDEAGLLRDRAGDRRDEAGDLRDTAADLRDERAGMRDVAAEQRDQAAATRDRKAAHQEDANAAIAREEAASDRARASQDRADGASERDSAGYDRNTAHADRGAGAKERTRAGHDRETAELDREAGLEGRNQAEHDRDSAEVDRTLSATRRADDADHLGVLGLAAIKERARSSS